MTVMNMEKPKTDKRTKQTAAECYAERHAECQNLLKRIGQQLEVHSRDQQATSAYWTHAGDLGHVTEQLAYILAFLGDRSAVDQKGLEY